MTHGHHDVLEPEGRDWAIPIVATIVTAIFTALFVSIAMSSHGPAGAIICLVLFAASILLFVAAVIYIVVALVDLLLGLALAVTRGSGEARLAGFRQNLFIGIVLLVLAYVAYLGVAILMGYNFNPVGYWD